MANRKVSALTAATAPTGAEMLYTVQDGVSKRTTVADVVSAANVAAAGSVMESDTTTAAMGFVLDEDNMASDSATKVPTQQSVKAYADTKQPGSANLTTLAAVAPGATGLALLDDTTASAARTTLELGSAALLTSGAASGNLKPLNADGGLSFALDIEPTISFSVTPFAGNSANFRASTVHAANLTDEVNLFPRTGFAINRTVKGGGDILTNPFTTTNGSAVVSVAVTGHNLLVGNTVMFEGASAVGGITIDGQYSITSVTDANNYTITHTSNATSAETGGGTVTYSDTGDKGTTKANSGMVIFTEKQDWRESRNFGEVDGLGYIVTAQGINGDTGGINIGTYKIDGRSTDGLGSTVGIEAHAYWVDDDFALPPDFSNLTPNWEAVALLAYGEGPGPAENSYGQGDGMAICAEGRRGNIYSLIAAIREPTNVGNATCTWAYSYAQRRNQTSIKWGVDDDGSEYFFNSRTDASNYEAGVLRWSSNVFQMGTDSPGTGTTREWAIIRDGTAQVFSSASAVSLAVGMSLVLNTRVRFGPTADGVLTLSDNAATSFGRLNFGGSTSSFPALKRNTTAIQVRLADDSDYATIQGRLRSHANAVAETPSATHTIQITDAAGTAYKVLCVAA
jgi:hypothetical protein